MISRGVVFGGVEGSNLVFPKKYFYFILFFGAVARHQQNSPLFLFFIFIVFFYIFFLFYIRWWGRSAILILFYHLFSFILFGGEADGAWHLSLKSLLQKNDLNFFFEFLFFFWGRGEVRWPRYGAYNTRYLKYCIQSRVNRLLLCW
jgi:hypothetical protein